MASTTIKVPVELRDRLARRAHREHTSLAGAIESSLELAEADDFWREVDRSMVGSVERSRIAADAAVFDVSLRDGVADEGWDDIL